MKTLRLCKSIKEISFSSNSLNIFFTTLNSESYIAKTTTTIAKKKTQRKMIREKHINENSWSFAQHH